MAEEAEFNHLPQLIEAMHKAVSDAVKESAVNIHAGAKDFAPKDTDFLESSIYIVTHDDSTYGQGVVQGHEGSYLLPEVDKPSDDQTAYVAVGADYGLYVEYGSAHHAAEPYLIPALDNEEAELYQLDLEESLSKVK